MARTSSRLATLIDALPLKPGMRILEIGCGPGVAAREVCRRIGDGYVLAIDRSAIAIRQAIAGSEAELSSGRLAFLQSAAEHFELPAGEGPFDLAFAFRVGTFDGRHPTAGELALAGLKVALKPGGRLYIDGGNPLREIEI